MCAMVMFVVLVWTCGCLKLTCWHARYARGLWVFVIFMFARPISRLSDLSLFLGVTIELVYDLPVPLVSTNRFTWSNLFSKASQHFFPTAIVSEPVALYIDGEPFNLTVELTRTYISEKRSAKGREIHDRRAWMHKRSECVVEKSNVCTLSVNEPVSNEILH